MSFQRFGLFHLPGPEELATFGGRWLGWDLRTGCETTTLDLPGRAEVTRAPHKYGFHATLKPPFRLAEGATQSGLEDAVAALARTQAPARCDGLELARMGRFLALVPRGEDAELHRLADACVTVLDPFRAPATPKELARRRGAGLRPDLEANLIQWGYPYLRGAFRFHITLTDRLARADLPQWEAVIAGVLPELPAPFEVSEIALVGERPDGRFALVRSFPLSG